MQENKAACPRPSILKNSNSGLELSYEKFKNKLYDIEDRLEAYLQRLHNVEVGIQELYEDTVLNPTRFTISWDPTKGNPRMTQLQKETRIWMRNQTLTTSSEGSKENPIVLN